MVFLLFQVSLLKAALLWTQKNINIETQLDLI